MSEQTETFEDAAPKRLGDTTYVVQTAVGLNSDGDVLVPQTPPEMVSDYVWRDIATVTVPRKSPRRKVIGLALAQSGIRPAADSEPLRVRVLDVASASETSVAAVQPDPEWKVG